MNIRIALAAAAAFFATSALVAPGFAAPGAPGHTHGSDPAHGATGTGQPGNASDVSRVVRIEARDTAFNVKQIQVKAGETIKFVVTNKGKVRHEFAIASSKEHEEHRKMMQQMPDMQHDEPNVATIEPGETKEIIWKFGKDTDVEFSCNIPGHAEQGMKGAFRVMR
jgi:uncharacterized cupredoxin-like copper-binding protein